MSLPVPVSMHAEIFEDALEQAKRGEVVTELPFGNDVLDALIEVAAEPSAPNVAAARLAFDRTRSA